MTDKIAIAHVWTSGLSTPDPPHKAAVADVVADDIERIDARGTVRGKEQVVAEFGTSTLADAFAKGTWSEPTVAGHVVSATCTFPPGSPLPGVVVRVTVNDAAKITRVQTELPPQPDVNTDPDPEALRSVVKRIAPGATFVCFRQLAGAGWGRIDEVELEEGDRKWSVVLKRHRNAAAVDAMHIEFGALRSLHALGLPVPEPFLVDDGELFGRPALVMERLPGGPDIAPKDPHRWAQRVGEVMAAIHAVDTSKVPGLKSFAGNEAWPDSWLERARRHSLGQRLWDTLHAHQPTPTTPGLVHADFHSANVLWSRGRITGVIDWAWPHVGSVEIDLAEARVEAMLLFGSEVAETMRTSYQAARGSSVAEMAKWDMKAAISFGLVVGVESWHHRYRDLGRTDLTLDTMRSRLDAWIAGLLDGSTR